MPALQSSIDDIRVAAAAADRMKATDIVAFDVTVPLGITDIMMVATASNERQVGAIVDAVEEAMHKAGSKLVRREGRTEARWILLDFGEVVAHVQHSEDRVYYALERLWKDCPVVELPADVHGTPADADLADGEAGGHE